MRPFTGKGDSGYSSTSTKNEIPKHHAIFQLLGQFDRLNAEIGVARTHTAPQTSAIDTVLYNLQNELFEIGADINMANNAFNIANALAGMEQEIMAFHELLPALTNFILPGGSPLAASLHLCRTQARELERVFSAYFLDQNEVTITDLPIIMKYLNRLSSLFFTLARAANNMQKIDDVIWEQKSAK